MIEVRKGGVLYIQTDDGRKVEVPSEKRLLVELAYALTIHKSQGSEWPVVLMVCSSGHYVMHDRALLYTGASRASHALVILGDKRGTSMFATRLKSRNRQTRGAGSAQ